MLTFPQSPLWIPPLTSIVAPSFTIPAFVMYPHISLALAFASTFLRVKATPLPVANPTPELELLRRQGLATVYDSCTVPNTVAITFDDGPYIYESGWFFIFIGLQMYL